MGHYSSLKNNILTIIDTKIAKIAGIIAALIMAFALAVIMPRLTVVESFSLPYFLYYMDIHPDLNMIKMGTYVRFVLKHPLYKEKNDKSIKRVSCMEGDELTVDNNKNYYCNGTWLCKAKDRTLKGDVITNFLFNGPVPKDSLFVVADHKDSLDSRYIGFLRKEDVLQIVYPLF